MVKFALIQKIFVITFVIIMSLAILLIAVFNMRSTALVLLLINFIVAGLVTIFGSLRIRDEEEEKLFK